MQRGKNIEDCTQLFDAEVFDNPTKASTYIYKAFAGDYDFTIDEAMQNNVTRHNLIDMMTFGRVEFEKNISLSVKKKVKFEAIWGTSKLYLLGEIAEIKKGTSITKEKTVKGTIPVIAGGQEPAYFHNESNRNTNTITVSASGAYAGFINYFETPIFASDCNTIISNDENKISTKLIYLFLKSLQNEIYGLQKGQAQPHVYGDDLSNVKIPLPPIDIQQKIVSEIEALELKEKKTKEKIEKEERRIDEIIFEFSKNVYKVNLSSISSLITKGSSPTWQGISYTSNPEVLFVTSENVREGFLDLSKKKYLENKFNDIQPRSILQKGDLLINIVGASIGRACIFNLDEVANINQAVALVRCNQKLINVRLLNRFLNSIDAFKMYDDMKVDVARANLSLQNISDLKIPLPPLSEQQKIVSEIEKIEAKINVLETEIATIPQQKEAVLKKYL